MRHKEKPAALRVALIGLIGTLLTVCGGLAGALISASVTIWQRDQSVQVWEDLQAYAASFRVIR